MKKKKKKKSWLDDNDDNLCYLHNHSFAFWQIVVVIEGQRVEEEGWHETSIVFDLY